jgi:hypothetical protein
MGSSIVHNSRIASALVGASLRLVSDVTLAAFAVLTIAEVEPAVLGLGGNAAPALLDSVSKNLGDAAHLESDLKARSLTQNSRLETERRSEGGDYLAEDEESSRNNTRAEAHLEERSGHGTSQSLHGFQKNDFSGTSSFKVGDDERASSNNQISAFEAGLSEQPLSQVQHAATTSNGGLLYLLNIASRIDLAASITRHPGLAVRGLRWSLHRLAVSLLPLSPNDAAALAFAGLLPDKSPPSLDQDITEDEKMAVEEYRYALLAALREAIQDSAKLAQMPDAVLIDFVCGRRAQVCGDPGWIEVHFAQDEVSTDIRRAGLDLDPGWLSWLGVVVKFIYV